MPFKNETDTVRRVNRTYQGENVISLFSSNWWLAERAGEEMRKAGYSRPIAARISRGYSVRIATTDNEFTIKFIGNDLDIVQITRH